MDTYQREKIRNVTENGRITRIELGAVISDAHYDAVTLRVFATSLDYTITEAGKVVSGSRTKERAYTEHWTLIRGSQARPGPVGSPTASVRTAGRLSTSR